jgi:hypothetical protein
VNGPPTAHTGGRCPLASPWANWPLAAALAGFPPLGATGLPPKTHLGGRLPGQDAGKHGQRRNAFSAAASSAPSSPRGNRWP